MGNARIIQGTVFDALPTIESGSIDCACTSPPYWMLRAYIPKGHPLKHLELGQEPTPAEYVVYAVRTCDKDRKAHGGFQWPESGLVEAPDWKPTAECGNGLHACPWGVGDWSLLRLADPHAVYQVVEVPASEVVDLGGKIKFPRCWLVHSGDRTPALCLIAERRMTWMRGDASPVSSSGDDSAVLASGSNGVAAACGKRGRAKVGPGGIIAIAYHDADGKPLGFATGAAGRDGIEAGVWYEADPKTGRLVRCAE